LTTVSTGYSAPLDRAFGGFLNDPRDAPFVRLMASATLVVLPFAALLYVPGVFRWWLGLIYLAVNFAVFLDRFILMLHNTSHRALFKPRWRWFNSYIPWVLGPFFGETPETYFAHHVGMHHPENNLSADLSSTMEFQRDRASDFARYYGRFMFRGLADLARYLETKNRARLRTRMLSGEGLYLAIALGLMFVNWRATLVVFVVPVIVVRFLMMAGNWGQHAFVDAGAPESAFKNSITVLAERYNRRCFNDGYHIGHHVKANRHWTEMPGDFESNRELYAREGAIVFQGIDFFGVWGLLMLQRYRSLARHYVALEGATPLSEDEIVVLLRARTQAFAKG
jgi:fatty acid desaturase